jgi:hypothetical protein
MEEMIIEEKRLRKEKEELEQKLHLSSHLDLCFKKENRVVFITFKSNNEIKNIVETETDSYFLKRHKPEEFELENHGYLRTILKMDALGYTRKRREEK